MLATWGAPDPVLMPREAGYAAPMKRLTIRVEACTEILALLIVMAWADGKLADREKASVRAAAGVLNLNKELRARLDALLDAPVPLEQIIVANLSAKDRAFAYVAAVWLTGVDDELDPKEQDKLAQVADILEIDAARRKELGEIARELSKTHHTTKDGKDAWADDIVALFKAIPKHLEVDAEEIEVEFE